jgi:hypothetical protein
MQPIAVVMKPAEAVAALGIAVQSKVNVDFMKETVIVTMNVRVLLPVELEIVQYICFRRMRTVAKNQVINQMSLENLLKSIGYFKK